MAITSVPGLEANIVVNGKELQEYDDDEDEAAKPNTVTKYIEAISNATFEIRWSISSPFPHSTHDFQVSVYLDGNLIEQVLSPQDRISRPFHTLSGTHTLEGGRWFEHKFCFSEICTDDGDARTVGEQLKKTLDAIGEISVKLHRVKVLAATENHKNRQHSEISHVGTLPEKALKGRAISHQTSLRPSQPVCARTVFNIQLIDPKCTPFATFNFRYRSRAALKALCIIPRSPSPVPLEDRPVDDLSPEEMRELLKRQRERDATSRFIKQELKRGRTQSSLEISDDDELSVVEERPRKLHRTLNEQGIETIDLT